MSRRKCGRCGKDPATGYAAEWTSQTGNVRYCHGDEDQAPTCYERRNWAFDVPPDDLIVIFDEAFRSAEEQQ